MSTSGATRVRGSARRKTKERRLPDRAVEADASRVPVNRYHKLYLVLREKIMHGQYPPGTALPTEQELVSAYGVSRITVRRALHELAIDGLVQSVRGSGTYTKSPPIRQPVGGDVAEHLRFAEELSEKTTVRVLSFGPVEPPLMVLKALRRPPTDTLHMVVRIRLYDKVPLSYVVSYVPMEIAKLYSRKMVASGCSLVSLIEKKGVKVASAQQTIWASLADPLVAPALGIEVGSALLNITRVMYAVDGAGICYLNVLYRSDRFQYQLPLRRSGP